MYKQHPDFELPLPGSVLWRYIGFTKFVSLLDKQALFLARADKLGDPFEGSLSKLNVALQPHLYKDIPMEARRSLAYFRENMPRFVLISCWHSGDHESAAMWRLYSGERDGIAIRTDVEAFTQSFLGEEDVHIGKVRYQDYENELVPERNMFSAYLTKRKGFEHEREVRALYFKIPSTDKKIDYSSDICDIGLYFDVNIATLVKEIVVAPYAEDWFLELVQSVASRYNLKAPVRRSAFAESPVFG